MIESYELGIVGRGCAGVCIAVVECSLGAFLSFTAQQPITKKPHLPVSPLGIVIGCEGVG